MNIGRLTRISAWWFRLLLRFYPPDFRDEMGAAIVETYCDRANQALAGGGFVQLSALWCRALVDSLRNGLGERLRPAASRRRSDHLCRDLALVTRRLRRAPAFAIVTAGTLTLGLGMFAVAYTAFHRILIDPMPYRDPDDLYFVWRDYGPIRDLKRAALPGTDIVELQEAGGAIEGVTALQPFLGGVFSRHEGIDTMEISVTVASPNLFDLLGVAPALGRGFAPDDAGPGRGMVMMLTHGLWQRLGADPGIIGADVRLNGRVHTVIGVLPPDFTFVRHATEGPPQSPDAYTTLRVNLTDPSPNLSDYSVLIRARHGASLEAVSNAVAAVGRVVDARDFQSRGLKLYAVGLKSDLVAKSRPALLVLGAAALVLALMLMVNLSVVLLARAAQREHEFAILRALGANAAAVTRATFTEGGLLGLAGGGLGVLFGLWGTRTLAALAPLDLPRRESIALNWEVALVVIGGGAALGLAAAAVPARWAAGSSLSTMLASSSVRGGGGQDRVRRGLIVTQVGLSLVLLASGALLVRSLDQLLRTDAGFNPKDVFTVLIRTPPVFFPQTPDVLAFQDRVLDALAGLPGVTAASAVSALPLSSSTTFGQATITIPGAPGNTGDLSHDTVLADAIFAREGYFEVMGMRLVAGRRFEGSARVDPTEVVVDATLAKRFFPAGGGVGAKIPFNNATLTIVGIIEQARLYDIHRDGRPQIYFRAQGVRPLFYTLRTTRDPQSLLAEVRAAVRNVDSRVAVGEARTMDAVVANAIRTQRTAATLLSAFAVGALLLAAMGLFGVVAGSVTRRRHELAVRLAVGADYHHVLRMVLHEAALLVGIGVLAGLPGIYGAGLLIGGLLVGVSPLDPLTLFTASAGLMAVALITCYVPARRVLKIDPVQLLRET
jgi:putative ABC transport system permease protein